jgi:hypothetical protein
MQLAPKPLPAAVQGEAFGCPYKTLSPVALAESLRALQLPDQAVQEALGSALRTLPAGLHGCLGARAQVHVRHRHQPPQPGAHSACCMLGSCCLTSRSN